MEVRGWSATTAQVCLLGGECQIGKIKVAHRSGLAFNLEDCVGWFCLIAVAGLLKAQPLESKWTDGQNQRQQQEGETSRTVRVAGAEVRMVFASSNIFLDSMPLLLRVSSGASTPLWRGLASYCGRPSGSRPGGSETPVPQTNMCQSPQRTHFVPVEPGAGKFRTPLNLPSTAQPGNLEALKNVYNISVRVGCWIARVLPWGPRALASGKLMKRGRPSCCARSPTICSG